MNLVAQIAMAAAEAEHEGNIPLETVIFGIVAVIVFTALALVTLSYKNVANRHSAKAEAFAAKHGKDGHEAGHGH
ncbi:MULTISPECIES: hypothetical protein [Microbacterium]|uniref:hypothetical protein n=1 Tax=Microbacterium TaxID=33882 RepID=UPI000CFC0C7D|nr:MULTISPECIES: hypothetical protein [unclassified Microbacterium]PRB09890.1 hypothetical protein CQ047_09260 [Microbacterium sp. MYb72]